MQPHISSINSPSEILFIKGPLLTLNNLQSGRIELEWSVKFQACIISAWMNVYVWELPNRERPGLSKARNREHDVQGK